MSVAVPTRLVLTDHDSLLDLGRYAARARALDADGAVRLQAVGSVLATWVGVLPGTGLLGTGTTLGLRTSALAEPAELDVLVPLAAVTDRVARDGEAAILPVTPMRVNAAWAAVSPPRGGWNGGGAAQHAPPTCARRRRAATAAPRARSGGEGPSSADSVQPGTARLSQGRVARKRGVCSSPSRKRGAGPRAGP